jgi:hypothetical protein
MRPVAFPGSTHTFFTPKKFDPSLQSRNTLLTLSTLNMSTAQHLPVLAPLGGDDDVAHDISATEAPDAPSPPAGTRHGHSELEQATDGAAAAKHEAVCTQLQAVTGHAAAYLHRWFGDRWSRARRMNVFARLLLAAGRGPARISTCECTLRCPRTKGFHLVGGRRRRFDARPIVIRALSLFGPGELQELRVDNLKIFRFLASMLKARTDGSTNASQMAQALNSFRAVDLTPPGWNGNLNADDDTDRGSDDGSDDFNDGGTEDDQHTAAIIERCAATVTELQGPLDGDLLCKSHHWGHVSVLARCTRLEVLTRVCDYAPAVWLGLSHLHTLRGVDLSQVSVAAIAAALPRLHTLTVSAFLRFPSASAAGFFTDLLPRLRVFHFRGTKWPLPKAEKSAALTSSPASPQLQLEELVWDEHHPQPTVFRGFRGARPTVLHASSDLIVECLPGSGVPLSGLLIRVSELHVLQGKAFDLSDIAQALRAAPELRTFRADLHDAMWWLVACDDDFGPDFTLEPEFVGHPRLQCFGVTHRDDTDDRDDRDDTDDLASWWNEDCASRLRQTCFPRLRVLEAGNEAYFVTPLEEL